MKSGKKLINIRADVSRELEKVRAAKLIGNSLEASVTLYLESEELWQFLKNYENDLPMIFIVSEVKLFPTRTDLATGEEIPADAVKGEIVQNLRIECKVSQHKKCERCWNFRESVGSNTSHPTICTRCVAAL